MEKEELAGSPSRRGFLLGLAAAAAVPALTTATAQVPAAAPAHPEAPAADAVEVDLQMSWVTMKYGAYLKPEEMPLVRRSLERQNASIAQLMKVPIHNDDAPDCLFIPDGR